MELSSDQTRLLIVEDVPQVAQYIRGLLNAQQRSSCSTSSPTAGRCSTRSELRPDVVIVDALLQGRVKGPSSSSRSREAGLDVPVIVLTVPQNPVEVEPEKGVHACCRCRSPASTS